MSLTANQSYNLNLRPGGVPVILHTSQYDQGWWVEFTLYNGDTLYTIPEGVSGTIRCLRPDGTAYASEAVVNNGGSEVGVSIGQQINILPGMVTCEIVMVDTDGNRIGTANFFVKVESAPIDEDAEITQEDLAYAEQVLDQLQSVAAYNTRLTAAESDIDDLETGLAAEITNRANAVTAEATARQNADNTLQSNINGEASTRAAADTTLQSQIDQLVAPSGEAPSAAEVENARIGADGTTYDTLGNAIRGQVSDLKSALNEIYSEQIVGMETTENQKTSVNLFQYAELVGAGKTIMYVSGVTGKAVLEDNSSYNTYLLRVDGESTYTFTNYRCAVTVSDKSYTAVGTLATYGTTLASTGGTYILFCFNPTEYPTSSYSITKPVDIFKIPDNWSLEDVEIATKQIDGMTQTGLTVESWNLFSEASLVATGKYVDRITNGKATLSDNASYSTYIIPVDGVTTYTFTNCRTAAVVSDLEYTAVSALFSNVTSIDSTDGKYILFSFNPTTYPTASYEITHPITQYQIPKNWKLDTPIVPIQTKTVSNLASGGTISLSGKTAIKYGYQIIFKCFVSAFDEIKLAYYNYNNASISNSIVVDDTSLTVYVGSTAADTFTHGLTISNDFTLIVDYKRDGVEITLASNGSKYVCTTTFEKLTSGVVSPTIVSTGTTATDAVLSMIVGRASKPVWYFGDSYISYSNSARWAYYLCDYDYDGNTLLNGYAGGTSATTVMAMTALLTYGKPKYAVFATGMNDGSDSSSAPSTSWANARDSFLSLCLANGIEPIFATVPTVPSVDNEQKNTWVRSSGYRYIDFAKAVGADGTGAWYTGMLSSDGVHPTEKGAIALFTQALADFPEFLS